MQKWIWRVLNENQSCYAHLWTWSAMLKSSISSLWQCTVQHCRYSTKHNGEVTVTWRVNNAQATIHWSSIQQTSSGTSVSVKLRGLSWISPCNQRPVMPLPPWLACLCQTLRLAEPSTVTYTARLPTGPENMKYQNERQWLDERTMGVAV